ncbi:hypothetical protein Bbelb_072810 [Branchiostoma belcheri]|nr:hypothetical protein Bbelb_072810 [Branchiostoma belcheri]
MSAEVPISREPCAAPGKSAKLRTCARPSTRTVRSTIFARKSCLLYVCAAQRKIDDIRTNRVVCAPPLSGEETRSLRLSSPRTTKLADDMPWFRRKMKTEMRDKKLQRVDIPHVGKEDTVVPKDLLDIRHNLEKRIVEYIKTEQDAQADELMSSLADLYMRCNKERHLADTKRHSEDTMRHFPDTKYVGAVLLPEVLKERFHVQTRVRRTHDFDKGCSTEGVFGVDERFVFNKALVSLAGGYGSGREVSASGRLSDVYAYFDLSTAVGHSEPKEGLLRAIQYGLHKVKGISMEAAQALMEEGPLTP